MRYAGAWLLACLAACSSFGAGQVNETPGDGGVADASTSIDAGTDASVVDELHFCASPPVGTVQCEAFEQNGYADGWTVRPDVASYIGPIASDAPHGTSLRVAMTTAAQFTVPVTNCLHRSFSTTRKQELRISFDLRVDQLESQDSVEVAKLAFTDYLVHVNVDGPTKRLLLGEYDRTGQDGQGTQIGGYVVIGDLKVGSWQTVTLGVQLSDGGTDNTWFASIGDASMTHAWGSFARSIYGSVDTCIGLSYVNTWNGPWSYLLDDILIGQTSL